MPNAAAPREEGWPSRQQILAITLGIATLLALYVCYQIIQPFIPPLALALAVAVATKAPYRWLLQRVNNESWAAAIAIILVACVLIVPLSSLITYVVQQLLQVLKDTEGADLDRWREAAYSAPGIGRLLRWAESNLDIQGQLAGMAKTLAGRAGVLVAGSINLVTQLVIMLFVLFFLYRDQKGAIAAIRRMIPLSPQETTQILGRIADTIHATVNGSLIVALAQALLAGIMYTILGVPAAIVWGSATFIAALVPVFGTVTIWGPIAIYLAITGSWVKALVLIGWGALAVGTIDNFLYPYLVGNRLRLHTAVTFFSIVGGIALFGPSGLILGPVTLAITIGLMEVWSRRTHDAIS